MRLNFFILNCIAVTKNFVTYLHHPCIKVGPNKTHTVHIRLGAIPIHTSITSTWKHSRPPIVDQLRKVASYIVQAEVAKEQKDLDIASTDSQHDVCINIPINSSKWHGRTYTNMEGLSCYKCYGCSVSHESVIQLVVL